MPTAVDRGELRRLIDAGAQLAEVLPKDEYDDEHLPSALHLPLKSLTPGTVAHLDRHRPIVVYCWDALRDMSPRAAWRLEHLSFREVYDYVPGKAYWLAAGLPTEGIGRRRTRAVDVLDRSVPTCGAGESVKAVSARARAAGWDSCVVLNERRIALGRLRLDRADETSNSPVGDVSEPGPATVRADADVSETFERLGARRTRDIIVTTPEGELVGVLRASDDDPVSAGFDYVS